MRTLSKALFVGALVALLGGAAVQAGETDETETIKRLNREMQESILLQNDPAPLRQIALDQYLVIAPGGRVENRAQAIAGVDSLDVDGVELSGERVIFEGDTAVIVGRIDIDGTMQPLGKFPPMKYMAVFVKADGEWRALSRSMTPCAPIAVERGMC